MLHTRLNQPDRIAFDSFQDLTTRTNGDASRFTNNYQTPVLQPRQIALLRATIPNVTLQVPDYGLVFWYYAQNTSATTAPVAANLYAVRLYPRQWSIPGGNYSGSAVGGVNMRFCNTPADLVTLLNTAAAAGGDNSTLNPFWVSGDVTFSYSTTTNQITFKGNTSGYYYCNAGWNDPNVLAAIAGTASKGVIKMANQTTTLTNPTTATNQPQVPTVTLNEVLGYTYSGTTLPPQALTTNQNVANITALSYANTVTVPVDSFPDLVGTQCLYIYSSVVGSSGNTSTGQNNLLAVVPVAISPLGVINYTPTAPVFTATKIVQEIYQIDIEVRDDNNQPFLLPDSANLQLELGLKYDKPMTLRKPEEFE
jgi:hypothetical protein